MPKDMHKIVDLLNLFLDYNPTGLECFFFPEQPFPDTEELAELAAAPYMGNSGDLGVRVDGGTGVQFAESIIDRSAAIERIMSDYGGIESFRRVFTLYVCQKPDYAKVLADLSRVGSPKFPTAESVAFANHMTPANMRRVRKIAIIQLAREIYRRDRVICG